MENLTQKNNHKHIASIKDKLLFIVTTIISIFSFFLLSNQDYLFSIFAMITWSLINLAWFISFLLINSKDDYLFTENRGIKKISDSIRAMMSAIYQMITNDYSSDSHNKFWKLYVGSIIPLAVVLFLSSIIFLPKVTIVSQDGSHFMMYTFFFAQHDMNAQNVSIIPIPFCDYVINESGKELELTRITYGTRYGDRTLIQTVGNNMFVKLDNNPDYYFTPPPSKIRTKMFSSKDRYILDFK